MAISDIHHGLSFTGSLPFRKVEVKDFDKEHGRYLFARGFLVCREDGLHITPYFSSRKLTGGYHLYCHDMLWIDWAGEADKQAIVLLGLGLWASEKYLSRKGKAASVLLEQYQRGGREAFLEAICHLGGRWAVLLLDAGNIQLFTDACGLRSVYFCREARAFGSHVDLVNKVAKVPYSALWNHCKEKKYVFTYAYIGRHTPYEGIEQLVPNFSLSTADFSEKRFYPYKHRQYAKNLAEVKEKYFKALQNQMEDLCSRGGRLPFFDGRVGFEGQLLCS